MTTDEFQLYASLAEGAAHALCLFSGGLSYENLGKHTHNPYPRNSGGKGLCVFGHWDDHAAGRVIYCLYRLDLLETQCDPNNHAPSMEQKLKYDVSDIRDRVCSFDDPDKLLPLDDLLDAFLGIAGFWEPAIPIYKIGPLKFPDVYSDILDGLSKCGFVEKRADGFFYTEKIDTPMSIAVGCRPFREHHEQTREEY